MTKHEIDNQEVDLSSEVVADTLKNVFEACDKPQNTIPLELLSTKYKTQTSLYRIANGIAATGLIIVTLAIISFTAFFWNRSQEPSVNVGETIEQVEEVDAPVICNAYVQEGTCVIELEAGTYPVDYTGIYVVNVQTGETLPVEQYEHSISFPYYNEEMKIEAHVPDSKGNEFTVAAEIK